MPNWPSWGLRDLIGVDSKKVWTFLIGVAVGAVLTLLQPSAKELWAAGVRGPLQQVERNTTFDRYTPTQGHLPEVPPGVEGFTIIIQTYRRTEVMLKLLEHYQKAPDLRRIIVVWNNIGEETPAKRWNASGPHPVPVIFKAQTVNHISNRFQVFPEIDTDAILMLDDDILLSIPDVSFALSVWKHFPDQLVGFFPRDHGTSPNGVHIYKPSFPENPEEGGKNRRYSLIMTGVCLFHRRYLQLYQNQPKAVHELVDGINNCEDIALNFVIAHYLGQQLRHSDPSVVTGRSIRPSGVFVKPRNLMNLEKDKTNKYSGLWHRPGHFSQREGCLNRMATIYGYMPLGHASVMVTQYGLPCNTRI